MVAAADECNGIEYKNIRRINITNMSAYTRSISLHSIPLRSICRNMTRVSNVLNELRRCLPYVKPCYAVSPNTPPNLLSYLHEQKVELVCYTPHDIARVKRLCVDTSTPAACNEYIVSSVDDIKQARSHSPSLPRAPAPLLWVKTAVSNDGVERTREMFEYIWAHKCLLNGIVFDIHNFTSGYIPPTMYSYKIATEYVFRNMVLPFEREYGIQTPAIMIDGQDHITQIRHLAELHSYALNETSVISGFTQKKPELRLILGTLFDSVGGGREGRVLASHEYP